MCEPPFTVNQGFEEMEDDLQNPNAISSIEKEEEQRVSTVNEPEITLKTWMVVLVSGLQYIQDIEWSLIYFRPRFFRAQLVYHSGQYPQQFKWCLD